MRKDLRKNARFSTIAPRVRALWGTTSISEISRQVRSSREYIVRVARELGLPVEDADTAQRIGLRIGISTQPGPKPTRPQGFSPEQVLWARHHRHHPEALQILGPLGEAPGKPACLAYCRRETTDA